MQRDQDADAEPGGAAGVPQLVPLRVPDLHGRGVAQVLDGDDTAIGAIGGEFPILCVLRGHVDDRDCR